jgi:hypothetical protein
VTTTERQRARDRAKSRRKLARWALLAAALLLVFLVGIAFGQALDDAPDPGGVTTSVRTLTPLPQDPPARTVTVTVTQP